MLVMFWYENQPPFPYDMLTYSRGWALVQSVYHLSNKPHLKHTLKVVNQVGLGFSVCFPLITVSCLQAEPVRTNSQAFMMLAGQPCKF
jgi:hypothetical protein